MLDLANAVVIANPAAGGGRVGRHWKAICRVLREELGEVPVWRTERPGHARILAKEALWEGKDVLLSLGGDGTHSEVVGGLVRDRPRPGAITVGVLPAGTGGDFRRILLGSGDLREHARRLRTDAPHDIDVGVLAYRTPLDEPAERIFLNEASIGLGGRVCRYVDHSHKALGGGPTYFLNTLRALATYEPAWVRLAVDGQVVGDFELGTVMIANGRYAGAGMQFAPDAVLDDGMLDVIVVGRAALPRMLTLAPALYGDRAHDHPLLSRFRGLSVAVRPLTEGTLTVEADGDALGAGGVEATMIPGAIRMVGVRPDVLRKRGAPTPDSA